MVSSLFQLFLLLNYIKSSESAFESSQNTKDSQRKSTLRDTKVDPEKQPISILFLGIDDNEGREKTGKV